MGKLREIKKILAMMLVLAMALMCICQSTVFADEKSELESIVVKVKSLIDIPDELTEFVSDKYSVGNGVEYSLSWRIPNRNGAELYSENTCDEISVQVNSNRDIVWYRKNFENANTRKSLAKFSDDEYKSMAVEWLNKIIPDIVSEYEFLDIYTSVNLSDVRLTFERKKDGYNYCNNCINVRLDKQSGEVIFYKLDHLYTDNGADLTKLADENTKREGFLKQNKFEKFYIKKADLKEAVLVYAPTNPNVVLDSVTAEIPTLTEEEEKRIAEDKNFYKERVTENSVMMSGAGGSSSDAKAILEDAAEQLTEEEIQTIEDYSKLISPENAEKLIREIENTVIDECELNSYEYYKSPKREVPMPIYDKNGAELPQENVEKDVYYAVFRFANKSNSEKADFYSYTDASVTINAESGELVELYSYSYSDDKSEKAKLEKSVRESNALAFVKKYSPNEADRAKNFDTENENPYNFKFNESVNGIMYRDNCINVGVDEYSGKITRFSKNWTHGIKFENAENILSESDVSNILFNKIGFDEYYTNIAYVEYAPAIRLVYELKSSYPYYVSAKEGELLGYNGEVKSDLEYEEKGDNFLDIDGHYAENIINILVQNGVIEVEPDKMFRPNEEIIYMDAEKILEALNCNTYDYERAYKNITGSKLTDDTVLTRMNAVECILESIGYGKAARLVGIYNCDFADAEALGENVGYAMVAKALGIVNGDENGCFNPNDNVTRADFAIMIYNMLVSNKAE